MKPIEFYELTKDMLDYLAREKGVNHLERYYELTDYAEAIFLNEFSERAQVLAQMAFHAQNATLISDIVKFKQNIGFLKQVFLEFEPEAILEKYSVDSEARRKESVRRLVENLRYTEAKGNGLKWNSNKSKVENKDTLITRYANSVLDCAIFIRRFNGRKEFLNNLKDHYPNKDYKALIMYFREQVKHGFSIALTCDFLKEFDKVFIDIPKPDIHIKDTLCAFYRKTENYYSGEAKEYECIEDMQRLTEQINDELPQSEQITVYQLDKMIWLICSGNFYLDHTESGKELYLKALNAAYKE